ncbi:1-acyl-sn-glycerol-3-phosphate acyltransferase [Paraburkholderia sp. SIMBA_054]|uniref:1-acyl-sn-glycerol-3-phosphate acyltransferase n=1 Tax=Paraburkholderia sp. SIMBA_054 TaxID=3085795 RepID=UPI00397D96ED
MSTPIPTQPSSESAATPSATARGPKPLPIRVFRWVFARVALTLFRVKVKCPPEIAEILARGGVLVTGHHVSKIDAPLISLTCPLPLVFASDTDYSRRSNAARRGMAFLTYIGCGEVFDLDPTAPFGIRRVVKDLRAGDNIMIFPEGQITKGAPMPPMAGLAWIIERAKPARIHVTLHGAEQSRLFAKCGTKWLPRITLEYSVYETAQ